MDTFFIKIKRLVWGTIYTSEGAGKKNNEETRSEEERFFKHAIAICSGINILLGLKLSANIMRLNLGQ